MTTNTQNPKNHSDKFSHSLVKLLIDLIISSYVSGYSVSFIIFEHYMKFFHVKFFSIIFVALLFANWCVLNSKREMGSKLALLSISIGVILIMSFWVKNGLDEVPTPASDFFKFFLIFLVLFIFIAFVLLTATAYVETYLKRD